jgi:hypothetical protein
LVQDSDYVVFVADAKTGAPRDSEGQPFRDTAGVRGPSAALCASMSEAEEFADSVTTRHPELSCSIYDREGKAKPALAVVYDVSVRGRYVGRGHARRQLLIGAAFISVGVTLAIIDLRHDMRFIWGYVVGLKCLILGGTFVTRGCLELVELKKSDAES